MIRAVFVDSSAWAGLFLPNDQHHKEAVALFERLNEERRPLVTSTDVLSESVTLIRRRGSHAAALRLWELLERGVEAELIPVDQGLRTQARARFHKYPDHVLSFTDCTSFAIMDDLKILEALTFDADFRKAGFRTLPGPRYPGPLLRPDGRPMPRPRGKR